MLQIEAFKKTPKLRDIYYILCVSYIVCTGMYVHVIKLSLGTFTCAHTHTYKYTCTFIHTYTYIQHVLCMYMYVCTVVVCMYVMYVPLMYLL